MISAADFYPGQCEILIIDDASQDASIDFIKNNFPQIKIIQHTQNLGFAAAIQTGVNFTQNEYLIFLNSDVRPDVNFIQPLIIEILNNSVFASSPLILNNQGEPQFVSWSRFKLKRGKLNNIVWNQDFIKKYQIEKRPLRALFASGGSIALRRSRFLNLGGFLPIYQPFYWEDVDLCTRAWLLNWETRLVPESQVTHDHHGTIKNFYKIRMIRTTRLYHSLIYLILYSDYFDLINYLPWWVMRSGLRLMRGDLTYTHALIKLLKNLKIILKQRAIIQNNLPWRRLKILLNIINYNY